jgi:glutaredoxin 2
MVDENIHLKNRLIEILSHVSDKEFLEEIENFQNRFIKEDALIGLLRNDISELDKLFIKEKSINVMLVNEISTTLSNLRNNIINAEIQFSKLIIDFNTYLTEILITENGKSYFSKN